MRYFSQCWDAFLDCNTDIKQVFSVFVICSPKCSVWDWSIIKKKKNRMLFSSHGEIHQLDHFSLSEIVSVIRGEAEERKTTTAAFLAQAVLRGFRCCRRASLPPISSPSFRLIQASPKVPRRHACAAGLFSGVWKRLRTYASGTVE